MASDQSGTTRRTARAQAFAEAADMLIKLRPSDIRLAAGEMSAQEMRTVMAVLRWSEANKS